MRLRKGYDRDAVEKGGDANVAEKPIEAAKKAGYRNAYNSTGELLRNARIQQEIKRLKEVDAEKMPTAQKTEEEAPAEKEEILSFLTEVMRDNEEADLKTRMKAAELLGKRESLFEKGKRVDDRCRVVIVDDIP